MPQIKIYNGSSWLEPNAKVRGASSWLDPEMKYWSGSAWQTLEGSPVLPTVSARADGRTNSLVDNPCYSGCVFVSNGLEYEYNSLGSQTNSTTWLDTGLASADAVEAAGVRIGTPVVYRPQVITLADDRLAGTSVDDRAGCAAILELAGMLKEKGVCQIEGVGAEIVAGQECEGVSGPAQRLS